MRLCIPYLILTGFFYAYFAGTSIAQTYRVSGYILDNETQAGMPGATVEAIGLNKGTGSDSLGFFKLNLEKDSVTLLIEYLGYTKLIKKIYLNKNVNINLHMAREEDTLNEVVIEGNAIKKELEAVQMGVVSVESKDAKLIPVFFGEVDLLKVLQLKPGIQGGSEGNSGLYVRGGGPDQNLILLDNTSIYNASHLLGFFSLFNPDAVKGVDLYKGDFPARFGGRLSSVVDIKTEEGDKKAFHVKGGLGLISSRLSLEGPIKKDKASFIISARRTYLDLYTPTINKINKNKENYDPIPTYYFYDFNGKFNWDINPRNKISASGYFGKDVLDLSTKNFNSMLKWGNIVTSLNWNHIIKPNLFVNTTASYSQYHYTIDYRFNIFSNTLKTMISDYSLKSDFQYYPKNGSTIRFGAATTIHAFNIGRLKSSNDGNISVGEGNSLFASSSALYFSDEFSVNARWKFNLGMRYTFFANDSSFFHGPEPRFSTRFMISNNVSLKGSFSRMYQYIHLASNSGASLPNDIWFPASKDTPPQRSDLASGGINISMFGNKLLLTNEVYYKWMAKQIDIKEGAAIFDLPNLNDGFTTGKGWAYGNEFYLEKKNGRTTGWVGYTLSWTWRKFPEINGGEKFPARYDRRHNIAFVLMHRITDRLTLSSSWTFSSGNAVTLPIGRYAFQDIDYVQRDFVPQFMARNSFRMPSNHRLDLGLVWKLKPKRGEADITFSIYNVYNKRNAYFIYFEGVPNPSNAYIESFRAKQVSLFPVIPSIAYNFKF